MGRLKQVVRTLVAVATLLAFNLPTVTGHADVPPAPRDKRVTLVTDSVGLGVRYVLDDHFPDDWDVEVVGSKSLSIRELEERYVRPEPERFGDHVVIAAGYNFPFRDPPGLAESVDSMVETLTESGVEHIYWVTLREVKPEFVSASAWRRIQSHYRYFPMVNEHLERALERHPELTLVDWAAAADRPDITSDAIHLNRAGAQLYGSLIRRAVGDAITRSPDDGVTRVDIATPAQVASGEVVAAAINLTSVRGRLGGYLSAYPCEQGSSPSSNLNHARDQTIAAAAVVPVGPSGDICVFNEHAGHVVVDAFGTFGADADIASSEPTRVLDTRARGRQPANIELVVDVDPDATAQGVVALNVTATRADDPGFLTVHECSATPPDASNVNFAASLPAPNLVLAATDVDGRVCVTADQDVHVVVDVLATFGGDTTLAASTPDRLLDTRAEIGRLADDVVEIEIPSSAAGVVGNLTIVDATASGYATVYPCADERPGTSNINYRSGQTVANAVVLAPDADAKLCVYNSGDAHILFDLMATTGAGFTAIPPQRLADTRTG